VFTALIADVAVAFAEQASELAQGLLRENRSALGGVTLAAIAHHAHERQTMTVGRDEAHLLWFQDEQGAVEKVSSVLTGDRELRLRDHFLHRVPFERSGRR